ncbi:MAG: hypothetical protein HY445_02120 [Candidatus Niyogibacteria bacterium]|nr:hypothetical protein [Candidatus Niyogibacteria bacterium]
METQEILFEQDAKYFIDLHKATLLASYDNIPKAADVIYVFGRTESDSEEVLSFCNFLYQLGSYNNILIPGGEKGFHGFAGFQEWKNKLIHYGIPEEKIMKTTPTRHTHEEAEFIIKETKRREWKTIIFIAHAHQILRCFLDLVNSFQNEYSNKEGAYHDFVWLHAACPRNTDWRRIVYGNQGEKKMLRQDHIYEELIRIPKYQAKGDLASFSDFFKYLTTRETKK